LKTRGVFRGSEKGGKRRPCSVAWRVPSCQRPTLQTFALSFRGEGEGQDERRKTGVAGRENEEVFGGELRNGPRVT